MSQIALVCSNCGKAARNSKKALEVCGQCRNAQYCNKECQKMHWKQGGHKLVCCKFSASLHFQSTDSHVSFESEGGTGEEIDLPLTLFGKMTCETLARCMDGMLDDSKELRKYYDRANSEECWTAAEVIHALVLGFIADKQWSMASTYIVKWHAAFLVFQNSFPAGTSYDMANGEAGPNPAWKQVPSHVHSMERNGPLVTQMMLNHQNECTRQQVIKMPLGRARTDALYDIVHKLISEQDGWKERDSKTADDKLLFIIDFDRECVSILMNMGMDSGDGVDVQKNFNIILERIANAIQMLESHKCVPAGVHPYPEYLKDIAYFHAQHDRVVYLKTVMFGT